MVHLQFTSLVLGLLFALQALKETSLVHAQQGLEANQIGLVDNQGSVWKAKKSKKFLGDINIVGGRKMSLGGRKMAWKKKGAKDQELSKERSFKISGATYFKAKYEFEEKGGLTLNCKLGFTRSNAASNKFKNSGNGFVAFNDDYHGPARHPPIHN